MSIDVMSAIFKTEMHDLTYTKDGEERKAKASTCKLLLLAIADHANDRGESAYPGYSKLEIKTGLSRQGIADTLDALKFNGLLLVDEDRSRLNTNNYTINLAAFPCLHESSHLTSESQATLPASVKPLDLKHPLTIPQPSAETKKAIASNPEWLLAGGASSEEVAALLENERRTKERLDYFEKVMGYNPLPWGDKGLSRVARFLQDKTPVDISQFAAWSRRKYSSATPEKLRMNPSMIIDLWPLAFKDEEPPVQYAGPGAHKL